MIAAFLECRDLVATAMAATTVSRHSRASRCGHNGPMRRDYSRETGLVFTVSASFTVLMAPLLPLPGTIVLESLLREYSGLRVCSSWQPNRRTLELRGKWWTRVEGKTSVGPCGGHDEQSYGVSDRVVFPYHASCSFASALPFVDFSAAAGRAPGGGDGAVGHGSAQAQAGVQPPVPPSVVPEQQVKPEVEQLEHQQRSGTGSTRAGRQRTAVTEDRNTLLERFLRLRPMFAGEYDPNKAESWTHELERIFETMECTEEDQVRLAVYQLKGAAHEWWRVQRQTHFQGQRLDHITWQHFLEVFHGEYFPDYARRVCREVHSKTEAGLEVGCDSSHVYHLGRSYGEGHRLVTGDVVAPAAAAAAGRSLFQILTLLASCRELR
ncbi:hypothetical protein Taro_052785 [Colocasia esculenta]|uniref:Retrotransposon gag domain-containing protein n=1 Tax=Colocasia esculenta TaxID=4460 RepID=A0A843XKQ9_COLES|nr:hypothetical protein [Colocasia esculenta]